MLALPEKLEIGAKLAAKHLHDTKNPLILLGMRWRQKQKKFLARLKWAAIGVLCAAAVGYMYWDTEINPQAGTSSSSGSGLEKTLIMGTDPGFKPFEYKQGQNVVGFDVDLVREIAKDTNRSLQIEEISFDGLLPALQAGRIDLIAAGMTVTPDRAKNAEFSATYYTASQKVIVPKTGSNIESIDDLTGKRIGVQLGTTGDTLAHKISGASVVQLPATSNVMQELNARRIDAAIMDNGPATQYLATNPELTMLARDLSREDYAIAIKKGNTELLKQVNDSIKAMKKDGRYDALVKKHFGVDAS